jgi:hypothetical protein
MREHRHALASIIVGRGKVKPQRNAKAWFRTRVGFNGKMKRRRGDP